MCTGGQLTFPPHVSYLNKHAGGSEGLIGPSLGERRRKEGAEEALEGGGEGEGGPGELIILRQRRH